MADVDTEDRYQIHRYVSECDLEPIPGLQNMTLEQAYAYLRLAAKVPGLLDQIDLIHASTGLFASWAIDA